MSSTPIQDTLFDPPDSRNPLTVVELVSRTTPQDKQQATFQRLIRQIHDQRALVEEWQGYREQYHRRVASDMLPIYAQLRARRIALVRLLDHQFDQRGAIRGKTQRHRLRALILELSCDLLAEEHDVEVVALHDKYSDLSHAEQAELDRALSQDLVENLFGVTLDGDGDGDEGTPASMEEMFARANQKLREEAEQTAAQHPPRRKSAKAAAAEEKRAAAEKEVSLSVREVYRKLASALHPDRASGELSADQKTALMQRVNRAYDSGNLLELLNIQLEIEQIDAAHLANLPAARIGHYIQVLREQLAELKTELDVLLAPYLQLVPYTPKLKPMYVDRAMDAEIKRLKAALKELNADVQAWQDPKLLAAALKLYQPADVMDEFAELDALLDIFAMQPPPARRRTHRTR